MPDPRRTSFEPLEQRLFLSVAPLAAAPAHVSAVASLGVKRNAAPTLSVADRQELLNNWVGSDAATLKTLLANGEVDAVMHPDLIQPLLDKDPRVGRLFPDYKTEELAYYAKTKIFPIMHVMGLRHELVEAHPWVPMSLFNAFNEAKAIAMQRMANPLVAPLAWYEEQWEEQQNILGPDPWEYGLTAANRHNFGKLVEYAHKDGVIAQALPVDDFFTPVTDGVVQDKKRA